MAYRSNMSMFTIRRNSCRLIMGIELLALTSAGPDRRNSGYECSRQSNVIVLCFDGHASLTLGQSSDLLFALGRI